MAITTAMTDSYRRELMIGGHDHTLTTGSAFKIALIKATPTGTYGKATTNYSDVTGNSDEVANGSGYTTGGAVLTNVTPTISNNVAIADYSNNPTWLTATFSTDGALIYNTSLSNASVSTHDFGGTKTGGGGDFVITMPPATSAASILRLA